jgi:hypothetical protein
MSQRKVDFGVTSKLLLASFIASLIPFVTQLSQTGELPTKEALLSFGLVALLGILRVVQQIVLDVTDPAPGDTIDEPPSEPTDVSAEQV